MISVFTRFYCHWNEISEEIHGVGYESKADGNKETVKCPTFLFSNG